MKNSHFHLAELNFAKAIAPMDDPRMADFVAASPVVNALADSAPGFIWRYNPPSTETFNIRPFEDPLIYVTLSVWESTEALKNFVFSEGHKKIMNQRKRWFLPLEPHVVLWWIPVGTLPTIEEAKEKLNLLKTKGPTEQAFTFQKPFHWDHL